MLRRLFPLVLIFIIALGLLYTGNKVWVGQQTFFAHALHDNNYLLTARGGEFQLKDIAGKIFLPGEAQIEQFHYFIDRGADGKPFPIDKSSITIGEHGVISFTFSHDPGKRLLNVIKKRLLAYNFSKPNAERDLLYVPLGIDLRGGVEFICSLYDDDQNRIEADQQTVDILRLRLESRGLSEPQVSRLSNGDIQVIIPGGGKAEAARTRKVLETTGKLEFREVLDVYGDDDPEASSSTEPGRVVEKDEAGRWTFKPGGGGGFSRFGEVLYPAKAPRGETPRAFYRLGAAEITGQDVEDGYQTSDDNGGPAVGIQLNATGGSKSSEWTRGIKERGPFGGSGQGSGRFAICLDGVVYSAPRIIDPTGTHSRITGNFTNEEVQNLVLVLDTGALTVTPEVLSERVIGATLGQETISKGLSAMIESLIIVLAFIVFYYRRLGVVAMISLCATMAMVWTAVSVFSITMTLPGLAGLVLTIGMAVDANILIFERIREELAGDDIDLKTAIQAGYSRAFLTIFDANVTTFLTAFVLSQIGTGAVKGFGDTLMIGIIASMFGAIYIGRIITDLLYENLETTTVNDTLSKLPLRQPYVKLRFAAAILSVIIISVGMITFVGGGSRNFAIDFTGGNMVQATFKEAKTLEEVQDKLAAAYDSNPEQYNLVDKDTQILPYFSDFEGGSGSGGSRQYVFKARDDDAIEINREMTVLLEQLWALREQRDGLLNTGKDVNSAEVRELNKQMDVLKQEIEPYKNKLEARIEIFKNQLASALSGWIIEEHSEVTAASMNGNRMSLTMNMLSNASPTQVVQIRDTLSQRKDLDQLAVDFEEHQLQVAANYVAEPGNQTYTDEEMQYQLSNDGLLARIYGMLSAADRQTRFRQAELLRHFYDQCVDRAASSGLQVAAAYPASDHFSPQVAEQMKNKALIALAFSMLVILIYIAMRFELRYGVGALIALVHDVIATVGILAILGVRIDLTVVAALLTIVGYSLNDTIVVFDRIRENVKKYGTAMKDTIDGAIAQTMSRTILTSATTIFVIVVLLIFGGDGVYSFSVCMLVGLLFGTYSSIFVASPSLLLFKDPEPEDDTDEVVPGT